MARAAWKTLLFQDRFPTNSKSYIFLLGTDRSIFTVIDFLCEIQRKAERLLPLPGIPASTGRSLSGQCCAGTARISPLPHPTPCPPPSRGTGGSPFLAAATARRGTGGAVPRVAEGDGASPRAVGAWPTLGAPSWPRGCRLRTPGHRPGPSRAVPCRAGMCPAGPVR